jgi:hypothetical protein
MPKAHRAILIDAHTMTIREVRVSGLEDYYREMKVERIEHAIWLDAETLIYVDEEGLINGTTVGFTMNNGQWAGSGLVTAINRKTGSSKDLKEKWTAEGLMRKVQFYSI